MSARHVLVMVPRPGRSAGQIANDAVASLSGTVHEVRAHARAPCALNPVGDVVEEQA